MTDKDNILNCLKSYYSNKNISLPAELQFVEIDESISLVMCSEKIINGNMQEAVNSFEAWSIAIYLATGKRIILDVNKHLNYDKYENQKHLGRFLYRALRFNEQYSWFSLSPYLENEVSKFNEYLNDANNKFINNCPHGDAGLKTEHNDENLVESIFAEKGIPGYSKNPIFRQLPVGLFKNEISDNNMVFIGGKAAIDLWTWKDSEFVVIELKADKEKKKKMAGIITEIFFYSNYMRDLLCRNIFTLNHDTNAFERGYENIVNGSFDKITGVMLANVYHPIINEAFLNILNNNNCEIQYEKTTYDIDELLK